MFHNNQSMFKYWKNAVYTKDFQVFSQKQKENNNKEGTKNDKFLIPSFSK